VEFVRGAFGGGGNRINLDLIHTGTHSCLTGAGMVCSLTHMNSADIISALKDDGWQLKRITGSHHHFNHPTKPGLVTVPHPVKDIKIGTLKSIERQSGVRLR